MTAAALYETDSDFRALIQCWIDNRRCPLPMADYLRERGLEGQAEAAEWAAWEPDRREYALETFSGIFPTHRYWFHSDVGKFADSPPEEILSEADRYTEKMDFSDCLLWLLDRWAEVLAAGGVLPKVEGGVVTN